MQPFCLVALLFLLIWLTDGMICIGLFLHFIEFFCRNAYGFVWFVFSSFEFGLYERYQ
jgi:hypothetical protein